MSLFKSQFPYPSQRMPVMAKNMVAASQPLAVQAGLQAMKEGGNAVDAALAAAITLTVVEPTMNGIGGDAFCILWDGRRLRGLNASGRSPEALNKNHFKGMDAMPLRGWDTVTVPGCVSAWTELSRTHGKLPFEDLFKAAIHYADNGFIVSPITARLWSFAPEEFADFPDFSVFLPDGKAPAAGSQFCFPQQARTLESIAATNGEAFYRGHLAEKITAASARDGGRMTMEDLANHRCDWVDPVSYNYHGYDLHEIPPNGQGLGALIMLGILQHCEIEKYDVDSAESVHLQIEAMKLALADIRRHVSDPNTMDIGPSALLDENYLASRAALIDMKAAGDPGFGSPGKSGTVYLTTADEEGMMVSFIQSNFCGFGSGLVIPDTGISLQNRGAGFSLQQGHPNQADGGKRPFHTIIPAFLTKSDQPVMSFGVMGGHMQCQGHAQMVQRVCDHGMNVQAASDAPRWQVCMDKSILIENGFDRSVYRGLVERGHRLAKFKDEDIFEMGGAQLIKKTQWGYEGGSDHRKDGMAAGY